MDEYNLEKFTRIEKSMEEKTNQDLIQFLIKIKDVFSWSHEYMPVIDLNVIPHRLNVSPSYKPIRQKRRIFSPKLDNAIKEEVQKFVTIKFIQEVYYPN